MDVRGLRLFKQKIRKNKRLIWNSKKIHLKIKISAINFLKSRNILTAD